MKRKSVRLLGHPVTRRSHLRRMLDRILRSDADRRSADRGRLLLEPLEARQMLAGDVDLFSTAGASSVLDDDGQSADLFSAAGLQAEGEAQPDLVAFANALDAAGVVFYGAAWCPFCTDQKQLFEDGKEELPFVEVTNPDRTLNEIGQAENITTFPTWDFPDNSRATGVLTLEELSQRSGIAIPASDLPIFAPVGDQTVEIGSPLHIPIDGYDPDSDSLTVTVSVDDPTLVQATVLSGNRSARMIVDGWGEMIFELFEDRAPRPTGRFSDLAEAGFFDASESNEIIFHRVIDDFVLQSGDPTGTGSGGSTLGDFDDQFHPELQHNRSGVLSYAKSLDDTNDSQFFITEGQQRHLDYNHSIFGQLVEGDQVREAISETAVTASRPDFDIAIDSVSIFEDTENSVVMLKATGNSTGSTNVTVTITDPDGHSFTETFAVSVIEDQRNASPYLEDIGDVSTPGGTPAQFTLQGVDLEGDAMVYEARVIDSSGATATVDQATGVVTVTPASGFSGQSLVEVAVRSSSTPTSTNPSTRSSTMDLQVVPVNVGPAAPTGLQLIPASDTGISNSDGITNTAPVTFTVTGVNPGATVEILAGDTQIGVGLASGTTATITTNNFAALGDATHTVTARQTVNQITSGKSPAISVTYDTTPPEQIDPVASQATVGVPYVGDLRSAEEGSGLRYSLLSGPAGLQVDDVSGVINWTPTSQQVGDQDFVIRMTDAAGNSAEQTFTVNVGAEPLVSVRLEATDLDDNVLTTIAPGEEFEVKIYGDDERLFGGAQGIFAMYLDLFFDPRLAEPSPFTPEPTQQDPNPSPTIFTYSNLYNSGTSGSAGDGIIDEFGAFASQSNFLGPGERFLFSVRMKALETGALTLTTDPAEDAGHEVALFDLDDAVPVSRVAYGSLTLDIEASFIAQDDTATVQEDSAGNLINVLDNDTILGAGTTLTIDSVSPTSAEGGTVSINGNSVRYTPAADFFGTDTFTYTVSDETGATQTATVTATVENVNDAPLATNDTASVAGDTQDNRIDVLDNDTQEPDSGETLRILSVTSPSQGGTVSIGSGSDHLIYTPPAGFTGTETFTYTLSDGQLNDTATVTVTVTESNPPPIATNDSFTISEDAAEADYDVLDNDFSDDPTETIELNSVVSTLNGIASISPDGTQLRYEPNENFFGVDRVVYSIRDSNGATARGTATFTVTGVNDPPPAPNLSTSLPRGTEDFPAFNASDLNTGNVDGPEDLTISDVGTPTNGGTVEIDTVNMRILYSPPNADYVGPDSFTYELTDPGGLTASGTINVQVLDFTPRSIEVIVHSDGVANGSEAFSTMLEASLSGTDFRGTAINLTRPFDPASGEIVFANQPPGTYQVTVPAVPFLTGGETEQVFSISSPVNDGSPEVVEADFGNLRSVHVNRRDFLGSAPRLAAFVAVREGEPHTWFSPVQRTGMPENPVVSLSADGREVTIEIDDPDSNGRLTATLSIDSDHVDHRAEENGFHLLRVTMDPDQVNFSAVTSTQAATGTGEGESDVDAPTSPSSGSAAAVQSSNAATEAVIASQTLSANAAASTPGRITGGSVSEQPSGQATQSARGVRVISSTPTERSNRDAVATTAEGEAGPMDDTSSGSGEAIARAAKPSSLEGEGESLLSTADAVDSAMNDLLPQMQRRSPAAEALVDTDDVTQLSAIDSAFEDLGQ